MNTILHLLRLRKSGDKADFFSSVLPDLAGGGDGGGNVDHGNGDSDRDTGKDKPVEQEIPEKTVGDQGKTNEQVVPGTRDQDKTAEQVIPKTTAGSPDNAVEQVIQKPIASRQQVKVKVEEEQLPSIPKVRETQNIKRSCCCYSC